MATTQEPKLTRDEWFRLDSTYHLLRHVYSQSSYPTFCQVSYKQIRWTACACLRQNLYRLGYPMLLTAIELVEQDIDYPDARRDELIDMWSKMHDWACDTGASYYTMPWIGYYLTDTRPHYSPQSQLDVISIIQDDEQARKEAANTFRDIINCPIDPVRFESIYLTDEISSMAEEAYARSNRLSNGQLDSERLLVISDALEDADYPIQQIDQRECLFCHGCCEMFEEGIGYQPCDVCNGFGYTQSNIQNRFLEHLRSPLPHWPGCWALEAIRGAKRSD